VGLDPRGTKSRVADPVVPARTRENARGANGDAFLAACTPECGNPVVNERNVGTLAVPAFRRVWRVSLRRNLALSPLATKDAGRIFLCYIYFHGLCM
jgi:hypothetical protein